MRYLRKRYDYLFDRIDESMLYYSPIFRNKLQELTKDTTSADIAKDLLSAEFTDVNPDMTFIDIPKDKEGYISFSQINNADRKIKTQHDNLDVIKGDGVGEGEINFLYTNDVNNLAISTGVFTTSRNNVKLGKLINKVFPNKYKDHEIEAFVNKFKSKLEKKEGFRLVKGDDVSHWYNCEQYNQARQGTLNSSCMRQSSTIKWYSDNPQSVQLLILVDEDEKLIGRALVWKLQDPYINNNIEFEYLMDRIYYINDSDVDKFKDFAIEKGWAYKGRQSMEEYYDIWFNGEKVTGYPTIRVKMDNEERSGYPYLDTLQFYDPYSKILSNDEDFGEYQLNDTSGGYSTRGEYSEYHGETIPEGRYVWSDYHNSYLWDDRAVFLDYRDEYVVDDVTVYSDYHGKTLLFDTDSYYSEEDAVWSEDYQDYLDKEQAVKVIIDERGNEDWYPDDKEDDEYFYDSERGEYFHKDLMVTDYKGDNVLKEDVEDVVFSDELNSYITPELAEIMNVVYNFNYDEDIIDIDRLVLGGEYGDYSNILKDIFVDGKENPYKWEDMFREAINDGQHVNIKEYTSQISKFKEMLDMNFDKWERDYKDKMKSKKNSYYYGETTEEVKATMYNTIRGFMDSGEVEKAYNETKRGNTYKNIDVPSIDDLKKDIVVLLTKVFPIYKGMTKNSDMDKKERSELLVTIFNSKSGKDYDWNKVSFLVIVETKATLKYKPEEGRDMKEFNDMVSHYNKISKKENK